MIDIAGLGRALRMLAALGAIATMQIPVAAAEPRGRGLRIGVGGHDNWTTETHRQAPAERVFRMLAASGFGSYRVDVGTDARSYETLSRLVELGRRHRIVIRPMLYVDDVTADAVARIATAFSADIPLWELGNELNLRGAERFRESIQRMIVARRGIEMAAAQTGRPIQSAINVTAFAGSSNKGLNVWKDTYPFLDTAVGMGLTFDVISFHYYPSKGDRDGGWVATYLAPLRKYAKPVIVTETNCAEIYKGDDGDSAQCAATVDGLIDEIDKTYEFITEVILYELYDDPQTEAGAEQHFGILFDIDRPKRIFDVVSARALRGRPARDGAISGQDAGRRAGER